MFEKEETVMNDKHGKYSFTSFMVACGLMCLLFLTGFSDILTSNAELINLQQLDPKQPVSKLNLHLSTYYSARDDSPTKFKMEMDIIIHNPSPQTEMTFGANGFLEVPVLVGGKLVLGFAEESTTPTSLLTFCKSLRSISPASTVFILIEFTLTPIMTQIAVEYNVALIQIDKTSIHSDHPVSAFHAVSMRWILFDQLLKHQNGHIMNSFDKVLVVPVHNTAFQGDPFAPLMDKNENTFIAYSEGTGNDDMMIHESGNILNAIRSCFGSKMSDLLSSFVLLTSTTSLGTMDIMSDYIEKMSKILLGQSVLGQYFPTCETQYAEQGVHNVIVYADVLMNMSIKKRDSFPIVNVNIYPGFWKWSTGF